MGRLLGNSCFVECCRHGATGELALLECRATRTSLDWLWEHQRPAAEPTADCVHSWRTCADSRAATLAAEVQDRLFGVAASMAVLRWGAVHHAELRIRTSATDHVLRFPASGEV